MLNLKDLLKHLNRKLIGLVASALLFWSAFIFALPLAGAAVDSIGLSSIIGTVGSKVTLTEYEPPNSIAPTMAPLQATLRNYSIWFDINGNGSFESNEKIKSGSTTQGTYVSDFFFVPFASGNDSGVLHNVMLRDDTFGGYATAQYYVLTSRNIAVSPSFPRAGNNVTINLNLTGGGVSESRPYGVRVSGPSFTYTPWFNFTLVTNTTGSFFRTISFPGNFPGYSTSAVGNYTVQLVETFPLLQTNIRTFQVAANPAPNASITSISPSPAIAGQQMNFAGTGSDPNGTIIGYRWVSNNTGQLSTSQSFSTSLPAGTHLISLYVQDGDGLWSSAATRVVSVAPLSTVIAVIDSITVDSVVSPPQVTFAGHGIDNSSQITNYRWQITIGGTPSILSNANTFTSNAIPPGTYTVNFQVQNSQGTWSNIATRQFTIPPPGGFTAIIDSISPNPASLGQVVSFAGHGVISSGSIVAYQWTSDKDGGIATSPSFSTSSLSAGTHTISFAVQNSNSVWSTSASAILVVNSSLPNNSVPTAILDRSVTPTRIQEGLQVNFAGWGADSDGSISAYSWSSNIDGQIGSAANFATNNLSVGNHIISFTVQDNLGAWSIPATLNIEIVPNVPNQSPTATIDSAPSSVILGTPATFVGHGDDQDGSITGYRWTSDIDGQIGDTNTITISNLSEGTHTITFETLDDSGQWSTPATHQLEVSKRSSPPPFELILPSIGVAAGVIGLTLYFGRPPTSVRINRSFERKLEKEKQKREKREKKNQKKRDQSKPWLVLRANTPAMVFNSKTDTAHVTLTNEGSCNAKNVMIYANADSKVEIKNPDPKPFSLAKDKPTDLTMTFDLDKEARRGVYRMFFQASCQGAPKQESICFVRAVKIALLTTAKTKSYAEPLIEWMTKKGYIYDELDNADNLRETLFKYDLIVLAPELDLPDKWVRNLSTFVKNSQSLLIIDKVTANQNTKMAALLGYADLKFEPFNSETGQLQISKNISVEGIELNSGETLTINGCWGNKCTSNITTGTSLARYDYTPKSGNQTQTPAIISNIYGEGRVVHLNFHAEQAAPQIESVLERIFNWLLRLDTLPHEPEI